MEKYNFLEYDFYYYRNTNPLLYLIIKEQFETIQKAFLNLDENTRNLLDYFILNDYNANSFSIDVDIEKHINKLRKEYLNLYG